MTAILNAANSEKFSEKVDWAIFAFGAASLFVAVCATVATKTNLLG